MFSKYGAFFSLFILLISLTTFALEKNRNAYNLLSQDIWVDQNGKKFQITDFKQRTLILTIVYSDCTSICPMNIRLIKKFEKDLLSGGVDPSAYQFVLISIKSKNENTETMTKFLKDSALNTQNWIYIKTDEEHTRQLVNAVDMSFGPTVGASRHLMHSSKIALISSSGLLTDVFMTTELDQKKVDLTLRRLGHSD